MHNDGVLKVSEKTLIPKPLTAFKKNLGIGFFGFSKKYSVLVFFNGNRSSTSKISTGFRWLEHGMHITPTVVKRQYHNGCRCVCTSTWKLWLGLWPRFHARLGEKRELGVCSFKFR